MNRFKSQAWEQIVTKAEQWRNLATQYADDPTDYPKELGHLTHELIYLCDEHAGIDTSLFWDTWQQIERQVGKSSIGRRISKAELESKIMACVGLVERLIRRGTTNSKPGSTTAQIDAERVDSPELTSEQRAILFLNDEIKSGRLPSKTALAEKLDVSRRTLGNWRAFTAAYGNLKRKMQKQSPPRGLKRDGKIEAWRESGK